MSSSIKMRIVNKDPELYTALLYGYTLMGYEFPPKSCCLYESIWSKKKGLWRRFSHLACFPGRMILLYFLDSS